MNTVGLLHKQIESVTLNKDGQDLSVDVEYSALAVGISAASGEAIGSQIKNPVLRVDNNIGASKYIFQKTETGEDYASLVANIQTKNAKLMIEFDGKSVSYSLRCN